MKTAAIALILLLSFICCIPPACAQQAPGRIKAVILTGESDTLYHHWRVSTPFLRSLLEQTGRFDVKVLEQVRGATADTLAPFDLLLLNYNGPRWGAQTEKAVEEFVRSGKGMISLHGVTYGPLCGMEFDSATKRWKPGAGPGWAAYPALIGARWDTAKIGHGTRHVFPVKWVDAEHPIARGLDATFVANDELYHRLELLPGTRVLATAFSDPSTGGTGKDEPIVWAAAFGTGRTVHLTLGHDSSAMLQPGFAAAFARGAEWAATSRVSLPAKAAASEPAAKDRVRVLFVTGGHSYPPAVYTLFEGYSDILWSHAVSQKEAFTPKMIDRFDVVVLHDCLEELDEGLRQNLRRFVEAGKGVVSTHHAIVDYTNWPWWFEEVVGGKYFNKELPGHPASAYKDDVDLICRPTKLGDSHPVTRGVGPLVLFDEAYRGMWHAPGIQVLMETGQPLNDKPVVYIGPHPKARVVFVQPGHNESTIRYPAYRKLIHNAILWSAGKLN